MPSSGKTTLSKILEKKLKRKGETVITLDGDNIRNIFPNTGFTRKERNRHVERVGEAAILMAENKITVICALISPFKSSRDKIKKMSKVSFYLVYLKCDLEECIKRDVKGLYKKAINGKIKNFTGISQTYEEPKNADLIIDTLTKNKNQCLQEIIELIS